MKQAAKKLTLLLVTILLMLGVLEVGTRLFSNIRPTIGRRHPVLGKTYVPGFQERVYVDEARRHVDLRFNREGFRGPDLPLAKPPGTRRVAVLGDSMVAAVACDEEDTAVAQLGRMLGDRDPDVRWEAMNFGVSGASTGQELVLYREVVARYDPDVVVCAYFMGNDVTDNSSELSTNLRLYFELDEAGRLVQLPFSATRSQVSAWLNEHSRFYVWQKHIKNVISDDEAGVRLSLRRPDTAAFRRAWELNEKLIVAFRDEVERRGSQFVLALYPSAEQVDPEQWQAMLRRAGDERDRFDQGETERRLLEIGETHRVAVVPMTEAFSEALRAPDRPELFIGGAGHFTEAGNRLAAEQIFRYLTAAATVETPATATPR